MTDTQFREQLGAREYKPWPEPMELEQTLVMESDAGTPEQFHIKTTYSQGPHKKQMDEIFSSNKLKLSIPVTANIEPEILPDISGSSEEKMAHIINHFDQDLEQHTDKSIDAASEILIELSNTDTNIDTVAHDAVVTTRHQGFMIGSHLGGEIDMVVGL